MFFKNAWDMFIQYFPQFASGLGITLALSAVGVLFAAILGVVLCLMNISKYKVLKVISSAYIEVIRGIPLLLQLWVIYLLLPKILGFDLETFPSVFAFILSIFLA